MCEDHYLPNEFNYIIYQASSGGLSCPDSDARMNYYGVGPIPDLRFDGNWFIQVGAAAAHADGTFYMSKIDERRLTTSPMAVYISDFSYESPAFVEVGVKLFADFNPANHKVRVAVIEDDLSYGSTVYQNICRDMLHDQTLTISNNGETELFNISIPMNGAWNVDNLVLVAFVQNDANKFVENSGSSLVGEFAAVAAVDGPQQMIADGPQLTFGNTNVINVGLNTDTFDISIDTSGLPAGWDAHLLYDGSDYSEFSVMLDPFDSANFNVVMDTGLVGSGHVVVDIYSQGGGEIVQSLDFVGLAGGTDFLIVADDDGAGHAYDVYGPAIAPTGKTYAIWDRGLAAVVGEDLLDYDAVIWESGSNASTLSAEDRTALDTYMNAGGAVILAGEDLLESLYNEGGSARLWYQMKLRISYSSGHSGNLVINGVDGDPIGDGLSFTLTGGDPDQPSLLTGQPVEVSFEYGDTEPAVTRTTYGAYKVVYLPFGLERVPEQSDANAIMLGSLQWLGVLGTTAVNLPTSTFALGQNQPNPFNPMTKIAFNLDRSGSSRLEIFNTRGQLVRVLANESLPAGQHEFTWTGRTDSGHQAASGTYFYRLTAGDQTITKKMSLVK